MTDAAKLGAGADPLRFAVVGCGVIGRRHAQVISRLADAELAVAVDVDEVAAERLAVTYDAASAFSLDDALARDDVDVVAICTPSGVHAEQAVTALEAGKHVVIEKPVDVSREAARRLIATEATAPGLATVISQHRFDASSLAVREAIRTGRLGRVTSGLATVSWWRSQAYYDSGDWRGTWDLDGGGALMNQGIHTLDLLVWMLGRPVEVTAYTSRLAHTDIEVEDTAVAIVRFEGGVVGTVHATTAAYPGLSARLQVNGSQGSAIVDDDDLHYFHAQCLAAGSETSGNQATLLVPRSGDGEAAKAGADPAALSDAHSLQYVDFVEAIRSGGPPQVTIGDACTTLAVVLAIYQSATEGRPVPVSSIVGTPE
jgi:UDP-N-acetyl-2-amino-2-deoxyglucuronate dehydrogenase